jgi:hypothetical protein
VAKYLNITDPAAALASADNVAFNYSLGSGDDALNLAISASNLAAAGTGTREDFVLNISGGTGNDVISTAVVNDSGANGNGANALADADDATPWYVNQKANANLNINAGDGNDTVNTLGSGNWKINLGTGNDTYYADNTGNKAVWVFNTANQDTTTAIEAARTIDDATGAGLTTGSNGRYITVNDGYNAVTNTGYSAGEQAGLNGLKLRVVFKDVSGGTNGLLPDNEGQGTYISSVIDVPTASNNKYVVTDLNINQAIKAAINNDPVLSKLLVATDGPASTLVITSLSDGQHLNVEDLQVEFAIPTTVDTGDVSAWNTAIGAIGWSNTELRDGRVNALTALLGGAPTVSGLDTVGPNPTGTGYSPWYTSANAATASYHAAFANYNGTDLLDGVANSGQTSDNTIDAGTGNDVIVLSTGGQSNDTIKWTGYNNGANTIVNFDTAADSGSTPAELGYTLGYGTTTLWDTAAGYDNGDTFTIEVIGVGTTALITAGVDDDATELVVRNALDALFSTAGWNTTTSMQGTLLYEQVTPNHIVGLGSIIFHAGSTDAGGDQTTPSAALFNPSTTTNAVISSTLGDDWLDFTDYGARLLVAATLDAGANQYVNGSTWSVLTDVHAAKTVGSVSVGQLLPTTPTAAATPTVPGDNLLKVGDKYITLTRSAATTTTETDPHSTTLYKVELWTVAGTVADAYLQNLASGDTRDSAQVIGYVDVGKVIDGDAATTGILAHIDYI